MHEFDPTGAMKTAIDNSPFKELEQLRDKFSQPIQGSQWKLMPMSARVIQVCFDMQKAYGLSDEKMLAGMAVALAEALDSQAEHMYKLTMLQPPASIIMCPDCPKKESVLASIK